MICRIHWHSMARANLKKSVWLVTNTTAASKYIPSSPRISINWNPPFSTSLHKILKEFFLEKQLFFFGNQKIMSKKQLLFSFLCIVKQKKNFGAIWKFFKIYFIKKVWKAGFQLMRILGLLGISFDAAVVFVTSQTLVLRLDLAILCWIVILKTKTT